MKYTPLKVVARVAAVAAVLSFATACTSDSDGGGAASGTLTVGWAEPIDTLNPAVTGKRNVGPIDTNIFDTLVWLTPDLKPTPHLATEWDISEDGKDYTFTLREDVTFHDGTPFNADAVVANIDYITAPETKSTTAIGLLGPCKSAETVSEFVVKISCETAFTPLIANLGTPYTGIQSPAAIDKYGADLGLHPVGTGPFKFVNYTPNQSVSLKKNEDYAWAPAELDHEGPANVEKLEFKIATDPQARVSSLTSGQTQVIQQVPGRFFDQLKDEYQQIRVPISGMGIFSVLNAERFPTDDVAVRRAILSSVDREPLIKVAAQGAFKPNFYPLSGFASYEDPSLEAASKFDPAKAESYLEDGGWQRSGSTWTKGGRDLEIDIMASTSSSLYPAIAEGLQAQLESVGFKVKVSKLAGPAAIEAATSGTLNMSPLLYVSADPFALRTWFTPGEYFNWSQFDNDEVTALLEKGQQIPNGPEREAVYIEAQKMILDQAVLLPIAANEDLVLAAKGLEDVIYAGGGFEYFLKARFTS